MRLFGKILAAASLAMLAFQAQAAPVDLAAEGYEATTDVFVFGPADYSVALGTFSATELSTGSTIVGLTASDASTYSLNLGDLTPSNFLIASSGQNTNFGPTPLELLFTNASAGGTFAAADGKAVLLSFNVPGLSFADGSTGSAQSFSVTVLNQIAPIPLPAGAVLIMSAMGGLVLLRRQRA